MECPKRTISSDRHRGELLTIYSAEYDLFEVAAVLSVLPYLSSTSMLIEWRF